MTELGFAIFETAIGRCGIVWGSRGIVGVQLPEASERSTRNRVLRRFATAREATPPAEVQRAIEEIVALISGEPRDLRYVRIDNEDMPDLHRRVYDVARTIPPGGTLTYGEIAERLGDRTLARDVGEALSQNPWPSLCPATACWRPVANWAASRRTAASIPNCDCFRSRVPSLGARCCLMICQSRLAGRRANAAGVPERNPS
jgi:methylated-DNA-[protein]-cysteine S-methyltransferase